jgi:phage terminase small subunit
VPFGSKKGKSAKRELFVQEYLIDFNAGAAYKRAYPGAKPSFARREGFRLKHDPEIAAKIEAAKAERAQRLEITADRVLAEYAKIAFMDLDEVLFADSEALVALSGAAQLIRVKMHAKLRALAAVGRHLGIGNDKLEEKVRAALQDMLSRARPRMKPESWSDLLGAVSAEMGVGGMAPPGDVAGGNGPSVH